MTIKKKIFYEKYQAFYDDIMVVPTAGVMWFQIDHRHNYYYRQRFKIGQLCARKYDAARSQPVDSTQIKPAASDTSMR